MKLGPAIWASPWQSPQTVPVPLESALRGQGGSLPELWATKVHLSCALAPHVTFLWSGDLLDQRNKCLVWLVKPFKEAFC